TFSADNLEVSYVSATDDLGISGANSLSFNVGNNSETLAATLGTSANPGLLINSGDLVSLDIRLTGNISAPAVTFSADHLEVSYVSATDDLGISGSTSLSFNVGNNSETLAATLGTSANPGLLISGGDLVSLDISLTGNISGPGVTFSADHLEVSYVSATQ